MWKEHKAKKGVRPQKTMPANDSHQFHLNEKQSQLFRLAYDSRVPPDVGQNCALGNTHHLTIDLGIGSLKNFGVFTYVCVCQVNDQNRRGLYISPRLSAERRAALMDLCSKPLQGPERLSTPDHNITTQPLTPPPSSPQQNSTSRVKRKRMVPYVLVPPMPGKRPKVETRRMVTRSQTAFKRTRLANGVEMVESEIGDVIELVEIGEESEMERSRRRKGKMKA
ncbi:hypothetical protein VNI00_016408 [Paramarasmius palmivorus]|uniref:Uncharacterized protein n=1 Tax=Paramarasmius palmivorus TaxID=297713 RepID=A0AAW0BDQ5_9AGAR